MNLTETTQEMFIDGERVAAAEGETEPVINPATGETIGEVAKGSVEDVNRAVAAAERAFPSWAEVSPSQRALALLRLAERLEENAEEMAQLESVNVGKPISAAREEIPFAVDHIRFFAGASRSLEGRAAGEYEPGYTSIIRRDPLGVVGSVAPWNFPLLMGVWKICPALLTGNTLVLKPSEQTPLTTLRLAEMAADLLPDGVLNIITGHGEDVGAGLVGHPRVRMSSLTGDVATGKEVMRAAAGNLKKVHLELGGKAPVIIFDDADIELAVERIREGGYANSGPGLHGVVTDLRLGRASTTTSCRRSCPRSSRSSVGDPTSEETEMGPVISERHQAARQGIRRPGASTPVTRELATGGRDERQGLLLQPEHRRRRPAGRRDRQEARSSGRWSR